MIFGGDREKLGQYIRHVADEIGLRDWTVVLSGDEPDDDDANASCNVTYGQRHAVLKFRKDWADREGEDVRKTVVHELIHCHTWSMNQRICDLHDILGRAAYEVIEKAFTENLEHAVDGMACEWARFLPLPAKSKKKAKS